MIGRATPYIYIKEFSDVVERHQILHKTIHEIHAVCNAKYNIDEIEKYLLNNHVGAIDLLEYCKKTGRLPDSRLA